MTDEQNLKNEFIVKFIVGGISGVISKTLLSPLDRIKIILQTQKSHVALQDGTHKMLYTGLFDALIRIPKHQGFLSLWRGNWIATVKFFPQQALNFSIYSYVSNQTISTIWEVNKVDRRHLEKKFYFITLILSSVFFRIGQLPYMWSKLLAGAVSGGLTTLLIYPLFFCQTRISADTGSNVKGATHYRTYTGLTQCLTRTIKLEGFFGIYSGTVCSVIGYSLNKSLYFAFFDYGKLLWVAKHPNSSPQELPPFLALFSIAQVAALSSATLTYPLDTIAKRLMLQSGKPERYREYKGMINCMVSIYRQYGLKEFFAGNLTNSVRSLGGALVLVLNDAMLNSLGYL